jgi:hypothetical protein
LFLQLLNAIAQAFLCNSYTKHEKLLVCMFKAC